MEWNKARHVSLLLVAMTSMLAANVVSPATAQESPSVEVETSRYDIFASTASVRGQACSIWACRAPTSSASWAPAEPQGDN